MVVREISPQAGEETSGLREECIALVGGSWGQTRGLRSSRNGALGPCWPLQGSGLHLSETDTTGEGALCKWQCPEYAPDRVKPQRPKTEIKMKPCAIFVK